MLLVELQKGGDTRVEWGMGSSDGSGGTTRGDGGSFGAATRRGGGPNRCGGAPTRRAADGKQGDPNGADEGGVVSGT